MAEQQGAPAGGARLAFGSLSAEEQEVVRAKQREAKLKKKLSKADAKTDQADHDMTQEKNDEGRGARKEYPTYLSQDDYFDACPRRMFHDPSLIATEAVVDSVMQMVDTDAVVGSDPRSGKAVRLSEFQYFVFAGSKDQAWDATFYARLAFEGFFTITTTQGPRGGVEPLPELQPFYGVVDWTNFNDAKHVKKTLRKLREQLIPKAKENGKEPEVVPPKEEAETPECDYHMYANVDLDATYKRLDEHQKKNHGSNWMTQKYFDTMKKASADPNVNFKLHSIELYDGAIGSAPPQPSGGLLKWIPGRRSISSKDQPRLIAGEIGYSIGQVYTSLSGFYTVPGCGTVQLVCLGRWLEHKRYVFWSLGHCYSPHMEYKRQLGHRIYPRADFLQKMRKHRGDFRWREQASAGTTRFEALADGEECNLPLVLSEETSL